MPGKGGGSGRGGRRGGAGVVAALCAVMYTVLAVPAQAAWAADGEPRPYDFPDDATPVTGGTSRVSRTPIEADKTYKAAIGPSEKRWFRVGLDKASHAYFSVAAVPGWDGRVTYSDGIAVTILDRDGTKCGFERATFAGDTYPRPLTVAAERAVEPGSKACRRAGTYDVLVERTTDGASSQDAWDLELRLFTEPAAKGTGSSAPPAASPPRAHASPGGEPEARRGGTGFATAATVGTGVWTDRIRPGETRFYRVPVDWGQRVLASAELGACAKGKGLVSRAFALELVNPARNSVTSDNQPYNCRPALAELESLPAVDYRNRFGASSGEEQHLRFAGGYYLKVSLDPEVAEKYGSGPLDVTLGIEVRGKAVDGPAYVRDPGVFQVTTDDTKAAEQGSSESSQERSDGSDGGGAGGAERSGGGGDGAAAAAPSGTMQVVAAAGLGTGTLLVLGLGVWRVLAVRRERRGAAARV
ncbi:hypothetical protein [Streptomyces sp. NPDC002851]